MMRASFLAGLVVCAAVLGCASGETESPTSAAAGGSGGSGGSGGIGGSAGEAGSGPCLLAEDCASVADACNIGSCVNSVCVKSPTHEGLPCNDGLECTVTEACKAGACVAVTQKSCPASDACHVGTCDLEMDGCTEEAGNDGAFCTDTDPCTQTSVCSGGTCVGGQMTDCSFLDTKCSKGVCDPQSGCVAMPLADGAACDDFLFCTEGDTCQAGQCVGGPPKDCAPPGNPCFVGVCNEFQQTCVSQPGNNGAACDDGKFCTAGETCSAGACVGGGPANPGAACDDADGCTSGTTCANGACGNPTSVIVACVDGDSCCPAGCGTDLDCSTDVLILYADNPSGALDVQANLDATGAFTAVDLYDVQSSTPQLADLQPYQAVLAYSNFNFNNPFALGNVLADYFDAGGRVVLATYGTCSDMGLGIEGRFVTDGYMVVNKGPIDNFFNFDSLGVISEPASPLVVGVNSMQSQIPFRCAGTPAVGSTVVAQWASGLPLIVRGVVNGKNRVDLQMIPVSQNAIFESWTGDGANILKNALLFK